MHSSTCWRGVIAVSTWLRLEMKDGKRESISLLAVGCLDGRVSIYRMKPHLLEFRCRFNSPVSSRWSDSSDDPQLLRYKLLKEKILLTTGDSVRWLYFQRIQT
jgi:hypothetical protein